MDNDERHAGALGDEALGAAGHSHPWYDDDFCKGGDVFVGTERQQVACPVCGEMMDVDEEGHLFKHRPRIPKDSSS
jgi:hypothetical protein